MVAREKQTMTPQEQLRELDKVAKMLVRRDLELSETRAKREEEQAKVEQLRNEFVSLAAHQLRTPLSAIKWALEALLDGDAGPLTLPQRELLLNNRISNERMIALVNDLLDVTRIEEGRYLHQPTFSQFEELAQDVVLSYRVQADLRNIALVFDVPKEKFPRVLIDKEKMQFVIHNLVDNALRYSHPGGRVEVTLSHDNKEVVFSIKDFGIGIPEEQKARLFEKFFRASNAKQLYTEGTGLGLYLSKNIIEAHEGKIWAESKAGEGSTFSFSLPIKQEI